MDKVKYFFKIAFGTLWDILKESVDIPKRYYFTPYSLLGICINLFLIYSSFKTLFENITGALVFVFVVIPICILNMVFTPWVLRSYKDSTFYASGVDKYEIQAMRDEQADARRANPTTMNQIRWSNGTFTEGSNHESDRAAAYVRSNYRWKWAVNLIIQNLIKLLIIFTSFIFGWFSVASGSIDD